MALSSTFSAVRNVVRAGTAARQAAPAFARFMSTDISSVNVELTGSTPDKIIGKALDLYGEDCAISFSGAEDVVLIEYAKMTGKPFRVFSLDTGRLHPETYKFFDAVEKKYDIKIEYCFPKHDIVEKLVREKGMFSFFEDGHKECCTVRKVEPLARQLGGLKAWITGQRKDQSPGTRTEVPLAQVDPVFKGMDGGQLVKFNPLSDSSARSVWNLIREKDIPFNEVHLQGMISIGCQPCTRPVTPAMHEREGRWWWEEATAKECGLHSGNKTTK